MTNPTIGKLRKILDAVGIGGWYDANPNQRESDYLDVDVAEQAIIAWALEIVPKKKKVKSKSWTDSTLITADRIGKEIGYNKAIDDFRAKLTGGTE